MARVSKSFKGKIITLCGSTKFKKEYLEWQKKLTLEGHIVLTVGCWPHTDGDKISPEQKEMIDKLHLCKIDLSDEIYVINPKGYIGESTKREIDYAMAHEKCVWFTTGINFETMEKHGWRSSHGTSKLP